jgi:cold shock CspA family protein
MPTGDTWITCAKCSTEFVFTAGEQAYYRQKNISPPRRCRACREQRKAEDAERLRTVEEAVAKAPRSVGVVEQYDPERGYGFIACEGDVPLFFHCRSLRCKAREILAGVRVEFYRIPSVRQPGKFCAERVTVIEQKGDE